jgi:hypothetical protein
MSNQANLGLAKPIDALTNVVSQHAKNGVSRADIWALAATVGVDVSQNPNSRIDFQFNTWGRVNCENTGSPCLDGNGKSVTCSATKGPHRTHPGINMFTADLYKFFSDEFGYDQTETITILGAHTIGSLTTTVRARAHMQLSQRQNVAAHTVSFDSIRTLDKPRCRLRAFTDPTGGC